MLLGRSAGGVLVRRMAPANLYPATLCLIAPGFVAFWGGFPAPVAVFGLFVAGLAIALLSLSLASPSAQRGRRATPRAPAAGPPQARRC